MRGEEPLHLVHLMMVLLDLDRASATAHALERAVWPNEADAGDLRDACLPRGAPSDTAWRVAGKLNGIAPESGRIGLGSMIGPIDNKNRVRARHHF